MFYLRIIDAGWLESVFLCVIVIVRKWIKENWREGNLREGKMLGRREGGRRMEPGFENRRDMGVGGKYWGR